MNRGYVHQPSGGINRNQGGSSQPDDEENVSVRCLAWLRSIPIVTLLIMLVCFATYIHSWFNVNLLDYALCPQLVFGRSEYWRLLSAPFYHAGFFHFFFNMLSFYFIAKDLEPLLGSLSFLGMIVGHHVIVIGVLCLLIEVIAYYGFPEFAVKLGLLGCGIGFSGAIFAQLVIQVQASEVSEIPCCTFPVPALYYLWLLLFLISFLMPEASFVTHFFGIVVGYMYCGGFLNWFSLPRSLLLDWETHPGCFMQRIINVQGFQKTPASLYHVIENNQLPWTKITWTSFYGNWSCGTCGSCIQACCASIGDCLCTYFCCCDSRRRGDGDAAASVAPAAPAFSSSSFMGRRGGHVLGERVVQGNDGPAWADGGAGAARDDVELGELPSSGGIRLGDYVDQSTGYEATSEDNHGMLGFLNPFRGSQGYSRLDQQDSHLDSSGRFDSGMRSGSTLASVSPSISSSSSAAAVVVAAPPSIASSASEQQSLSEFVIVDGHKIRRGTVMSKLLVSQLEKEKLKKEKEGGQ